MHQLFVGSCDVLLAEENEKEVWTAGMKWGWVLVAVYTIGRSRIKLLHTVDKASRPLSCDI